MGVRQAPLGADGWRRPWRLWTTWLWRLRALANLLKYRGQTRPAEAGAIWLTYYPTIMVEWYPHVLVVSTLHP